MHVQTSLTNRASGCLNPWLTAACVAVGHGMMLWLGRVCSTTTCWAFWPPAHAASGRCCWTWSLSSRPGMLLRLRRETLQMWCNCSCQHQAQQGVMTPFDALHPSGCGPALCCAVYCSTCLGVERLLLLHF